jgi:transposase
MLLLPRAVRILLAREPVDMRNSIDGLAAIVRTQWKENLYAGHLFVFVSRRGDRVKILSWDAGGFVLTYKRLYRGRFARPWAEEGAASVELTASELALFLEGCELAGRWKLSPPAVDEKVLAVGRGL